MLKQWPDGGPRLLWTATGCGAGFSSPAIAGDTIYVAGDVDGKSCLMTFDLNGGKKLKLVCGEGYDNGTRSTATVDEGLVYVLSARGDLACADARTLRGIWKVTILLRKPNVRSYVRLSSG